MKYKFFQLDTTNINVIQDHKLFESWEMLNRTAGFSMWDYENVYEGDVQSLDSIRMTLDSLFCKFNLHHPADFCGRSMSVSDVVEMNGKRYYCDNDCWVDIETGKEV